MVDLLKLQGIWTQYGLEKLASIMPGEEPLAIAFCAVGDGNGSLPVVEPSQTELLNEVWRGPVNGVTVNPDDPTDVLVDAVIPNNVGGFFIREWGIFDADNKLIAVGPHDEMHKPLLTDGQAAEFLERFHLPVSNT
ncbi:MAG: phage tail protein, partial [Desulfarculales bacterium]|nr:phage tail protein [Desulfarculales bacterium]